MLKGQPREDWREVSAVKSLTHAPLRRLSTARKSPADQEAERAVRLWEHLWVGRILRRGKELPGGNKGECGRVQQGEEGRALLLGEKKEGTVPIRPEGHGPASVGDGVDGLQVAAGERR